VKGATKYSEPKGSWHSSTTISSYFPHACDWPFSGLSRYSRCATVYRPCWLSACCNCVSLRQATTRQRPKLLTATPPYGISMFVTLSAGHNYTIGLISGGDTSSVRLLVIRFRGNHKAVSVATAAHSRY